LRPRPGRAAEQGDEIAASKLIEMHPVCTENSDLNVLVMQAADQGMRYDASGALNRARDGRILV
jgi:hypothetical protein